MRFRIAEPIVVFLLAYVVVIVGLVPEALRLRFSLPLLLIAFMILPWPGYRSSASDRASRETRNAERFSVAVLCIVWLFGIAGTATIREYGSRMLEEQSLNSFNQLSGSDIVQLEKHIVLTRTTDFRSLIYIASPKERELIIIPANQVFHRTIEKLLWPIEQGSIFAFFAGLLISALMLYIIGHIHISRREF